MKTETLQESLGVYQEKLQAGERNPAAAYELALRLRRVRTSRATRCPTT